MTPPQSAIILITRGATRGNTRLAAQGERREGADELIKMAKQTRGGTVRVTFELPATEPAGAVSVVGDFNGWDPYAHPLRKRANGARSAVVTVPAGATVRFRYLAEGGIWFDDETAGVRDAQGARLTIPG
jgi:1,4-alpha-glucan branching enzyme